MFKKISLSSQKNTSLLIALGVGIGITLIILPIILISIVNVVRAGEKRLTEIEVSRIDNLLQEEVNRVSRSLGDWSNWTETYQFAENGNGDYIINNLMDETFKNLDIHGILILNNEKEILFQKFFNINTSLKLESPIDVTTLLISYPELVDLGSSPGLKGLAMVQGLPMIVASNPILTSFNEGPPSGTLVFIKFLDQDTITKMSELSLKKITIYSLDDPENALSTIPEFSALPDEIYAYPIRGDTIIGYKYLKDLYGNPFLILEVENSRDLNLQARTTMAIVSAILLFLFCLLSVFAYYYTKAVLSARERKKEEEIAAMILKETRQNAIELEKRVVERTRELEIRNKDLETFNYTVSHDLKTPLRGISGFATLLMIEHSSQLDEKGMGYLHKLVDAAGQMHLLILDLLSYTKTDRTESKKTRVDLENLVDDLLLDCNEELIKNKITIKKDLDCKAVMVDREGLKLALRNLLDNAIKFSQKVEMPEIIIGSEAATGKCVISVADNGIGFDMKYHDKIFDIFQRLHLPEEYPGTGVGLALVKKALERMGGKVYAESAIGKGSTFYLEIPMD